MTQTGVRKRPNTRALGYLVPVVAVALALLIAAVMLGALGASPLEGFAAMLEGAFGSTDALVETALKATPLLLVGVGITIAFRANVINIGGEGQMVLGGLFATIAALYIPEMHPLIMIPIVMAAGIGSRYGGLKQIEPVGPGGEIILDYSIYDARRAGFSKIVFVINKKIEENGETVVQGRLTVKGKDDDSLKLKGEFAVNLPKRGT